MVWSAWRVAVLYRGCTRHAPCALLTQSVPSCCWAQQQLHLKRASRASSAPLPTCPPRPLLHRCSATSSSPTGKSSLSVRVWMCHWFAPICPWQQLGMPRTCCCQPLSGHSYHCCDRPLYAHSSPQCLLPPLPPCSKACPLNNVCEYARNSGPSLHGRKRVRQPAPILGSGDGMAEPLLPDDDERRFGGYGPSSGMPAALWRGRGGSGRGRRSFITDSSGESDGDVRSVSISGGSDSGGSSSEEEDSEVDSPRGLGVTTRRQAAALAPKPTLRQVRTSFCAGRLATGGMWSRRDVEASARFEARCGLLSELAGAG